MIWKSNGCTICRTRRSGRISQIHRRCRSSATCCWRPAMMVAHLVATLATCRYTLVSLLTWNWYMEGNNANNKKHRKKTLKYVNTFCAMCNFCGKGWSYLGVGWGWFYPKLVAALLLTTQTKTRNSNLKRQPHLNLACDGSQDIQGATKLCDSWCLFFFFIISEGFGSD